LTYIERPTVLVHVGRDDRHRYDVLERLQLPEDDGAVRPGAGKRNIKVIAAGLGGKAAFAGRPRTSVGRHPIAKLRSRPDEMAVLGARNIVLPDAIDKKSHAGLLNLRRLSFRLSPGVAPRAMDQNRPKC